jgi:hypothetical protein
MRARSLVAAAATLILIVLGTTRIAAADPRAEVAKKIKAAMDSYDMMDYDAARKLLNQALAVAKRGHLDKDEITAHAYLDLGIVAFANSDADAAKESFLSAVQIDPKIEIDAAYRSPDVSKLLDQARSEAGTGGSAATASGGDSGDSGDSGGDVDCSSVNGLEHTVIDTARGNSPLKVQALVASNVKATKVAVMYRPEGSSDFQEVDMTKHGACEYTATVPASGMHGTFVHYYVAAIGDNGKPVAAKGSAGSPNIIEIEAGSVASAGSGDTEDPMDENKGEGGSVSSSVTVGPKPAKLVIGISGGTGFGYVSGTTEAMNQVKNCCIGNSLIVLQPEIGYNVNPQLSVGIAGRIGLARSGEGLRVMGQVGAGIVRNTIKLDNGMPGMDTDVVAQGPLLLGGGVGFIKHIAGSVALYGDLSALAAIAVVDHLGAAPMLNTGLAVDVSLGLALGF